jgi:small conductance mechanosensitive channel
METEQWINKGIEFLTEFGPKVLGAIAFWIIGSWLIKRLMKGVHIIMEKNSYDPSLEKFLTNLISWMLRIVLVLAVLGTVGVQTSSFVAIVGAAGLAIGLALQGSLANFAGGVLILLLKPFKIGDSIQAQGIKGTVKEISIFSTILTTFGNEVVIIPNGKLSNDNITNFSKEENRRNAITAGISYDSDIKKARQILLEITANNEKILKDPAPVVVLAELGDSSVNLSLRYWSSNADFWECHFHVLEEMKNQFDANGISIPYPHRVVIQQKA